MAHLTLIHGISNQPPKQQLVEIWRQSLAKNDGLDLDAEDVSYEMVYWADVLYERPDENIQETESLESLTESVPDEESEDVTWTESLADPEKMFVERLAKSLGYDREPPGGDDRYTPPPVEDETEAVPFERIPVPWFVKRRLMKILLRDVHHYLFNATSEPRPGKKYQVRDEIRERFIDTVKAGNTKTGPHIVVSHSMGTVIAYDCLKRDARCPAVDGLMTIGCPLGLDEIQDVLGEDPPPKWTRKNGFPQEHLRKTWANVYDRLDPVCGFDPKLANDYCREGQDIIRDINEQNFGKWRHSIHKYLGQPRLQNALREMLF